MAAKEAEVQLGQAYTVKSNKIKEAMAVALAPKKPRCLELMHCN